MTTERLPVLTSDEGDRYFHRNVIGNPCPRMFTGGYWGRTLQDAEADFLPCPECWTRPKDMYGHLIHVAEDGAGFGVSLTWQCIPGGPMLPYMTVFHESDGFQQSLFSVSIERVEGPLGGGERPVICNVFDDRLHEVLDLVNQEA